MCICPAWAFFQTVISCGAARCGMKFNNKSFLCCCSARTVDDIIYHKSNDQLLGGRLLGGRLLGGRLLGGRLLGGRLLGGRLLGGTLLAWSRDQAA